MSAAALALICHGTPVTHNDDVERRTGWVEP